MNDWGERINWLIRLGGGTCAAIWGGLIPLVQLLLILMALDIVAGVVASVIQHRPVTSDRMWAGVGKKIMVLTLVGAAAAIETQVQQPVDEAVSGFYCAYYLLSLLESAVDAGLPVPDQLKAILGKLSPQSPPEANHG